MVYLINLIIIFFYYLIIKRAFQYDYGIVNKYFAFLVSVHVILFRVLSNPYNYVDTDAYSDAFCNISQMSFTDSVIDINRYTDWGKGYIFINWIVSRFTSNENDFFIIIHLLTLIPLLWFYYETSYNSFYTVLIYLLYPMMFYMGFGVLRQGLSITFGLLALYNFNNKILSLLFLFFSVSVHTSGVVLIPFYFWNIMDVQKINFKKLFLFIFVPSLFFRPIMHFFLRFDTRYEESITEESGFSNLIPVIWLVFLCFFFIISKIPNKIDASTIKGRIDLNLISFIFYGAMISFCSIGVSGLGRFSLIFIHLVPVVVTLFFKYSNVKSLNLVVLLVSIVITIRQLFCFLPDYSYAYSFFWQPAIGIH